MEGFIFREEYLFHSLESHFREGDNGRYYLEYERLNQVANDLEEKQLDAEIQRLLELINEKQCKILCKFSIN